MKYIFRILKSAKELWRYYVVISAVTILVSLIGLLFPIISGWAIDELGLGTEANVRYLLYLALAIFVLDVAGTFLNNIGGYLGDQMTAKLQRILNLRYYEHILSLSQSYFDAELSGKIINRLNRSIQQIANFMQMLSNNFLQFIFSTVFALIAIAYYSWQVSLLLFMLYPIYIFLTVRTSNRWQKYQEEKNLNFDIASGRFAEVINQIKVVKSFIRERSELKFFDNHILKGVKINKPQSMFWHVRDVRRRLVLNVIFLFVYGFIFVQAAQGLYSAGAAVALILLAQQVRIPIFTISWLVENTQRAVADSKDYFEIMDVRPDITDNDGAKAIDIKDGRIKFDNVSFGYEEQKILNGIDFEITPDTKVALVGESGAGKTTITSLLLRLYSPQSGSILIDGQDIATVSQRSIRSSIGVVFQDPALFSGTIRENITYGRPDATEEQMISASEAANAHEFISGFSKGYDTEIGERGLRLSGGQKQRIAIARALLKDAPILILDEATSSLDSRSEQKVQEALEHLMMNRTTIIIAHRLSTISHVDQIITLRDGKVDEIGAPGQLAKSGGIYAELLELQRGGKKGEIKKQLKKYEIST